MNTSNTARFEELMRLKNEFNAKLEKSFEKYESRIKKHHSIKGGKNLKLNKNSTTIELSKDNIANINKSKKSKILPPLIPKYIDDIKDFSVMPKRSNSQIKENSNIWNPPYMIGDYFDKFRRLQDRHEINDWEKVIYISK